MLNSKTLPTPYLPLTQILVAQIIEYYTKVSGFLKESTAEETRLKIKFEPQSGLSLNTSELKEAINTRDEENINILAKKKINM